MARVRLGGMRDTGGSATVYRTGNAFEVDELEGTDGIRRRIFFEDVFLVTYHREVGTAFAVVLGILCFLLGALTISLFVNGLRDRAGVGFVGAGIAFVLSAPLFIVFLNRVIRKRDVITIFGRHGRARMEFDWRKRKARNTFLEVCKAARDSRPSAKRARPAAPPPPRDPDSEPPVDPTLA